MADGALVTGNDRAETAGCFFPKAHVSHDLPQTAKPELTVLLKSISQGVSTMWHGLRVEQSIFFHSSSG